MAEAEAPSSGTQFAPRTAILVDERMKLKRILRRAAASVAAIAGAACAGSSAPGQPSGTGVFSVSLASPVGACYPRPAAPCTLTFEAVVTNPEDGPLTYAWSGCASGTARTATCTVDRPGEQLVEVRVTGARGQTTSAAGRATGANLPPTVVIRDLVLFESWHDSSGGGSFEVSASITDPEISSTSECGLGPDKRTVTAAGICGSGYARCIAGNLDIGAIKTAPSGECTFTLTGKDEWGSSTTVSRTFNLPAKK